MGPLSLVALVAERDGDGSEEPELRSAALRMLKEYLSFGSDGEGEGEGEGGDAEGGSGQFWVEYFRRLGLLEGLPLAG